MSRKSRDRRGGSGQGQAKKAYKPGPSGNNVADFLTDEQKAELEKARQMEELFAWRKKTDRFGRVIGHRGYFN